MAVKKVKADIIREVWEVLQAQSVAIPRHLVESVYDALTEQNGVIANAVNEGFEVKVGALGTFRAKDIAGRTGRNPATGEALQIPPTRKFSFTPSATMKTKLQEKLS